MLKELPLIGFITNRKDYLICVLIFLIFAIAISYASFLGELHTIGYNLSYLSTSQALQCFDMSLFLVIFLPFLLSASLDSFGKDLINLHNNPKDQDSLKLFKKPKKANYLLKKIQDFIEKRRTATKITICLVFIAASFIYLHFYILAIGKIIDSQPYSLNNNIENAAKSVVIFFCTLYLSISALSYKEDIKELSICLLILFTMLVSVSFSYFSSIKDHIELFYKKEDKSKIYDHVLCFKEEKFRKENCLAKNEKFEANSRIIKDFGDQLLIYIDGHAELINSSSIERRFTLTPSKRPQKL